MLLQAASRSWFRALSPPPLSCVRRWRAKLHYPLPRGERSRVFRRVLSPVREALPPNPSLKGGEKEAAVRRYLRMSCARIAPPGKAAVWTLT